MLPSQSLQQVGQRMMRRSWRSPGHAVALVLPQGDWTGLITHHVKSGQSRQALCIYEEMLAAAVKPSFYTFIAALKACNSLRDLETAKRIHADIVNYGYDSVAYVGTMLVELYLKCGSLGNARGVFERLPHRDVVLWNAMILGYCQMEDGDEALQLYAQMQREGAVPNDRTFVSALKACRSLAVLEEWQDAGGKRVKKQCLEHVRTIHSDAVKGGFESSVFLGTMLVNMYAKCGSLGEARHVFENMSCRDVVSWTAMILGYSQMGESAMALQLYVQMHHEGVVPDDRTFVAALKACSSLIASEDENQLYGRHVRKQCLEQVRAIHVDVAKRGLELNVYVGALLVDVYGKCGNLVDARCIFERMPHRNVVCWNAMIMGYAQMEEGEEALQLYERMIQEGVAPNGRTFVSALKACSSLAAVEQGNEPDRICLKLLDQVRAIHSSIVRSKYALEIFVGTMLVDAYGKCGGLAEARLIFDKMPHHNVISWTAMISAYAQVEEGEEALQLYVQMQQEGIAPNNRTFVGALKACSSLAALEEGIEAGGIHVKRQTLVRIRDIHTQILKRGSESDVFVGTMLVDVYAKCGSLADARRVFDKMPYRNVVSWNAMILGYAQMEEGEEALQLYNRMQQEGVAPNDRTFVGVLKACSSLAVSEEGNEGDANSVRKRCLSQVRAIHSQLVYSEFQSAIFVGNMLVDAYVKCGNLVDARYVFEQMPHHDVVTWTVMILGYTQMEQGDVALQLYTRMQEEGVVPDARSFVGALKACGSVVGLEMGKQIHAQISKAGLESTDSFVASSLLDMYAKCGSMVDAQRVFDALPRRDTVTWSVLMAGYANQGQSDLVFDLFQRMRKEGIQPDSTTFLSVLTACSHAGLADKGQMFLEGMIRDYSISPTMDHYSCLIDLLGRAGEVEKAVAMAKALQPEPSSAVWKTVLSACRKWGNVELGREAFDRVLRLDKKDAAAYVMMSSIYSAAHMLEEAKEIQATRVETHAWKKPGQSWWTNVDGMMHTFGVGDREHPESQAIYAKLGDLAVKMKEGLDVEYVDALFRDIPGDEVQKFHSVPLREAGWFPLLQEFPCTEKGPLFSVTKLDPTTPLAV